MIPAVLDGVSAANELSQIRAEIKDIDFPIRFANLEISDDPAWQATLSAEDDFPPQRNIQRRIVKKKIAGPERFWSETSSLEYLHQWDRNSSVDPVLDPVFTDHILAVKTQKQNMLKNKKKREFKNIE